MAKTRRRYSSRRRARGRKVKHSVKRRVHKKRNNRGKGKSKRRSRGRKHSRRMRRGGGRPTAIPCKDGDESCCAGELLDQYRDQQKSPEEIMALPENTLKNWYQCE